MNVKFCFLVLPNIACLQPLIGKIIYFDFVSKEKLTFLNDAVLFALFFSHSYVGPDYSVQKNTGKIALEQIDAVSPPCLLSIFHVDTKFLKCKYSL